MKTAIYIENGIVQLVLTPENEWEKNALRSFEGGIPKAQIFAGSFYDCRGGWARQAAFYPMNPDSTDRSIILRIEQDLPEPQSSTHSE